MKTKIYPLIVRINGEDVQIGSLKLDINLDKCLKFNAGNENYLYSADYLINNIQLQYKKGDFLHKGKLIKD